MFPENTKGRLAGRERIAEFVTVVCKRLKSLHFEPYRVIETGDVSIIEYHRVLNDDAEGVIDSCEVIVWRGDQVQESRVYHA